MSFFLAGRDSLLQHASYAVAVSVFIVFILWALWLVDHVDRGHTLSVVAVLGLAFGIVLQRSRFCFYCIFRDFFEQRDPRGLLGIIVALIIGTLGYHAVFGAFLPDLDGTRLPPDAHIGRLSWILPFSAGVFGLGMAVAGSCISAQFYRLGEGLSTAPVALLGAAVGFALGFLSWNTLYLHAMQSASVVWLPHHLGYGGSLLVQLLLLGGLAFGLLRYWQPVAASLDTAQTQSPLLLIFKQRWPAWVGGLLVGFIAVIAYFRAGALGVTAELGSVVRTTLDQQTLWAGRLEGLDSFAGCATVVKQTLLSNNGVFVVSLVLGSFIAALVAGQFKLQKVSLNGTGRALLGGVLMGWGAMVSLGCTVGVLLSGIMAAALSGWVFAVFCFFGAWLGWSILRNAR